MNKELKKEFDNLAYRYAHSGEPDHKLLWDFIEKALQAKEEEVVERIANKVRGNLEYVKSHKDFTNGWSTAESGPCCNKCKMDMREVAKSGRAVAFKTLIGCTDPFQISCKCHIPFRKVSRKAMIHVLEDLLFYIETRPDLIGLNSASLKKGKDEK